MAAPTIRICPKGHRYTKSSSCPVCPVCAAATKPTEGILSKISAPARRALLAHGVDNEKKLTAFTRDTVRSWHGVGDKVMHILDEHLLSLGMSFKK